MKFDGGLLWLFAFDNPRPDPSSGSEENPSINAQSVKSKADWFALTRPVEKHTFETLQELRIQCHSLLLWQQKRQKIISQEKYFLFNFPIPLLIFCHRKYVICLVNNNVAKLLAELLKTLRLLHFYRKCLSCLSNKYVFLFFKFVSLLIDKGLICLFATLHVPV